MPHSGQRASLILAEAATSLLPLGRTAEVVELATLALQQPQPVPLAHAVAAVVAEWRRDWQAALAHWRQAAAPGPRQAQHRFNLSLALMLQGHWAEGLALYECRYDCSEDWQSFAAKGSFDGLRHRMPRPGDELAGRRVLVFSEQGLGDCLWAARFLPALVATGARVTLACRPVLAPVLGAAARFEAVMQPPAEQPETKLNLGMLAGRFDHMVPLMSVPWLVGVQGPAGACLAPWYRPAAGRVAAWRARYVAAAPAARLRLGIVWRANPEGGSAAQKLLPVDRLAPLAALADVQCINLQGGDGVARAEMAAVLPSSVDALAEGEPPLDDFAAAVAATDLLLTVDTMAAHLCGSMGHAGLLALPAVPAFYWGIAGDTAPWYPSLSLLRQPAPGDWDAVVRQLVRRLAA